MQHTVIRRSSQFSRQILRWISDQRGHFLEYLQLLWEKTTSKRESADNSAGAREVMKAFQILVSNKRWMELDDCTMQL